VKVPARARSALRRINGTPAVADENSAADLTDLEANIDQAWSALEQVAKWIVHAEGKASLTLASAGVTGGVLFSVAGGKHDLGIAAACAAGLCAVMILTSALCAAVSLWPRFGRSRGPSSLFYFGDIAHRYPTSPEPYVQALRALLGQPDRLADDIANQIWANSHVAARKFRWANMGLGILIAALLALGLTCALLR
jgi:hypothetical protein